MNHSVLQSGLSICVFAHNEGHYVLDAFESVQINIEELKKKYHNLRIEKLLILDNPTIQTRKSAAIVANNYVKIVNVNSNDLGYNRNLAAKMATYDLITFLDGDDLWSSNWLDLALKLMANRDRLVIHPEVAIYCGSRNEIAIFDSSNQYTTTRRLRKENLWVSSLLTKTELVRGIKYCEKNQLEKNDFEDWRWNRDTFEVGIKHKVAIGTYLYAHTRKDSLSQKVINERF